MREAAKKYLHRPADPFTWYIFYSGKANLYAIESLFIGAGYPFKLWIPGYKVCRTKDNDIIASMKRAFPGYIFVSFLNQEPMDFEEKEAWLTGVESALKGQDAQFKLLRWPAGKAAGFGEKDLHRIDEAVKMLNEQEPGPTILKIGDFVRITSGPFAGMVGQVEELQHRNVCLKVFFLKQQVRMIIPVVHVQFLVQHT